MANYEQYEIWVANKDKWEFVAAFSDFDIASAVFRNRSYRQKLIHAVYDQGKKIAEDTLAEVGSTRESP